MKFIKILLVVASINAYSQKTDVLKIPIGIVNEDTNVGASLNSECVLTDYERVSESNKIVIYGKYDCKYKYGTANYLRAYYSGKPVIVRAIDVSISGEDWEKLNQFDSTKIATLVPTMQNLSMKFYDDAQAKYKMFVAKTKSNGLLIKKAELIDHSRTIEGVGFSISFQNISPKTIKYLGITLTGINPVDDVVSVKKVRAIGPIRPNNVGSYDFDFVWLTDIVTKFKMELKIDYSDGTSKIISNAQNLVSNPEYAERFKSED